MQWIASNWQAVLSIIAVLLSVGVMIAHLFHAESVASSLQNIEDVISKIANGNSTPKS